MHRQSFKVSLLAMALAGMAGCGGGGGSDAALASDPKLGTHTVRDPIDDTYSEIFPSQPVTVLPNGNTVIVKSFEDNDNNGMGRVYLYNPVTRKFIATFEDDQVLDRIGSGGITVLANGNFVISSPFDQVNGVSGAGSVMLVDGDTGEQIGDTIAGDNPQDNLGREPGSEIETIIALANGNFVVISTVDDVASVTDAGSVAMYSGTTGALVGAVFAGDDAGDQLGYSGVTELSNGNFVIASRYDDSSTQSDAGSAILVDGTTGTQLGTTLEGDNADDQIGFSAVIALSNGNYVVSSALDDVAAVVDAGSAMLMNGTTGALINSVSGDQTGDGIGDRLLALTNGNYVVGSYKDDVSAVSDGGSVRLFNGTNGSEIGAGFAGDDAGDWFGQRQVALSNGNFAFASPSDDGTYANGGSVYVVDGSTGVQIGTAIEGDAEGDRIGEDLEALADGNVVTGTQWDDNNTFGVSDSGSVKMINGTTGALITTIEGNNDNDRAGAVTPLGSNFMISARFDDVTPPDEATRVDAGSITFYGELGIRLGEPHVGNSTDAGLGGTVISGTESLVWGEPDTDVIAAYDGSDGSQLLYIEAATAGDFSSASVAAAEDGSFFAVGLPYFDTAEVDEGVVQVIVP